MTKEERSLLETLDGLVRSDKVHAQLQPIVDRVNADLARKADALMAWESVSLETFDALPASIQSGWVFILRNGADTGAERHPNSHQRMMTFAGSGDMTNPANPGNPANTAAGAVQVVRFAPAGTIAYIGTANGGVCDTLNYQTTAPTWIAFTDGQASLSIQDIAVGQVRIG